MQCTICKKPIILSPSAAQRAARFGGKPSDYTAMFTEHTECAVNKRNADTIALMRRTTAQRQAQKVSFPLASR